MSLFRTLQQSPATISIFHNARVPTSARVYASLEKAYFQMNEEKNLFQVDLMAKKMPTYDQFRSIYSNCVHDQDSKSVLKKVFPLLSDKLVNRNNEQVVYKSLGFRDDRGVKVFSQNEYERLHEAFMDLVEQKNPDIDPIHLFRAPLIVDWDQNMIACDEEGLARILQKYSTSEEADLLPA